MTRLSLLFAIALPSIALPSIALPSIALADPGDRTQGGAPAAESEPGDRPRFDYSRFSDGPRRVPAPRGASADRARALGLGTRESATHLLRRAPLREWTRAAGNSQDRLLWPIDEGRYVRGFGYVRTTRPDLIHKGVDIAAPEGSVVRAAADGIVAYSDNGIRGYGNCVLIIHGNGWVTMYAHASRTTVQHGWRVRRGERIALVGSTGISRGPHVHFELRREGEVVDPLALFDGGPAFVERVAERAAAAGRVPAPRAVTAADRPTPPPLAPFTGAPGPSPRAALAGPPAGPPAGDAPPEGTGDEELTDSVEGLPLGSATLAQRLLRTAPSSESALAAGGRVFRNLLWPVRGGSRAPARGALRVAAEPGSAVRATADGLVVFAGALRGRGQAIVLLHRSGWVSLYAHVGEIVVEAGQHVERGEWIARTSQRALELELRIDGRRRDPVELLVGAPAR